MAAMFTLVLTATDIEDLTPALTGLVGGAILVFAGTKSSGVARFFVLSHWRQDMPSGCITG